MLTLCALADGTRAGIIDQTITVTFLPWLFGRDTLSQEAADAEAAYYAGGASAFAPSGPAAGDAHGAGEAEGGAGEEVVKEDGEDDAADGGAREDEAGGERAAAAVSTPGSRTARDVWASHVVDTVLGCRLWVFCAATGPPPASMRH